jgi:hypothetical protein
MARSLKPFYPAHTDDFLANRERALSSCAASRNSVVSAPNGPMKRAPQGGPSWVQ